MSLTAGGSDGSLKKNLQSIYRKTKRYSLIEVSSDIRVAEGEGTHKTLNNNVGIQEVLCVLGVLCGKFIDNTLTRLRRHYERAHQQGDD